MSILFRVSLALFFMSLCCFFASLQIPHIGEGAPDWHTVRRPQIPVQSISPESCPPALPDRNSCGGGCPVLACVHPPIAIQINTLVCVAEPVYGWKFDCVRQNWVQCCVGTHAVSKYVTKTVTACWIETIHCYGFYDDYGRLKTLPDYH